MVLVGIGGPSGCGKTTLTRELVDRLETPLGSICADNFFDHTQAPMEMRQVWGSKKEKLERNLEDPEAVDAKLLVSELYRVGQCLAEEEYTPKKVSLQTPLDSGVNLTRKGHARPGSALGSDPLVLLVEGFLLYHNPEVAGACTLRLWIDIDCGTAMRRRYQRDGDPECEMDDKFIDWYENVVWPNYEKHRSVQLDNANCYDPAVFRINGGQSREQMLADCLDYVNKHLECGGIDRSRKEGRSRKEVNLRPRTRVLDDSRERSPGSARNNGKSSRVDERSHREHNGQRRRHERKYDSRDSRSPQRSGRERKRFAQREDNSYKHRRREY